MPELVLPPPRLPEGAPVVVRSRSWWRRRSEVAPLRSTAFWDDVRAHPGEPVPGGGTALLLCDLTPDADPDLVALADRLLLTAPQPAATDYATVLPVFAGFGEDVVHPVLRERLSSYACRYDRACDGMAERDPVADALQAAVNAKDTILTVGQSLRIARCGTVHLVAADAQVRDATLASLARSGWLVELPRPV